MFMNNLYICTNYVYYITMLLLLYSIYTKFIDLSSILDIKYYNVKIVKVIFISVIFFFLAYFFYDNYICYFKYEDYTNNSDTKFIKLSLGFILLILKLIINKIKENKIDFSLLLKYSIGIICPILLPPFMDYLLKFENNLHSVLNSLISGCVQLLALLSILFTLVPALSQCQFLDLRAGSGIRLVTNRIPELGSSYQNLGSNNKFKWNINIIDNTGNLAGNSSRSYVPQRIVPTIVVTEAEATSSSSPPSVASTEQEEGKLSPYNQPVFKKPDNEPVFKIPTTLNTADYDSDTDTTQH
jgi:hypothetical protein